VVADPAVFKAVPAHKAGERGSDLRFTDFGAKNAHRTKAVVQSDIIAHGWQIHDRRHKEEPDGS
jgi:hypothetical protein